MEKEKDSPLKAEVDAAGKRERSSKSTARCKVPVESVSPGCAHWGTTEGDQNVPLWHTDRFELKPASHQLMQAEFPGLSL